MLRAAGRVCSVSPRIWAPCSSAFPRYLSSSNPLLATIGIRREDKNRWERRVPLSPDHVQTLVEQGIDVVVQPSSLRIFDNEAYADVKNFPCYTRKLTIFL